MVVWVVAADFLAIHNSVDWGSSLPTRTGRLGQEWSLKWVYEEFISAETFGQSLGKLTNETGSDSRTTLRPR